MEKSLENLLSDLRSDDEVKAETASSQFLQFGEKGLEVLSAALNDEDPDVRWWVIRALATFDHPKATASFILSLNDPDIGVKKCAALALREHPDPKAVPDLIKLLGYKNPLLSRLAGDALIAIGEEATQELLAVVQKGSPSARVEATRALSAIGDTASISALFGLLEEDSTLIQHWAEEGLNKMGIGMVFYKPE